MYNKQTYETIKERILDNVNIEIDKREGSFVNNMLSPMAVELTKTYIEFDNILDIVFVKNSYGEYLDLKCMEWGITRKEGSKAKGTLTFTGFDGNVVPNGIEVSTTNGLIFVTTQEGIITNGSLELKAESQSEGVDYNVDSNKITRLITSVVGVDSVSNPNPFEGGLDREDDEQLKERFFSKVRTPSISGNAQHYKEWAMSVNGVEKVVVIPLWDGPGTVKVIISSKENRPVQPEIIINCLEYIKSVKPIGADVTVTTTIVFDVDISVNIKIKSGYSIEKIKQDFTYKINEYFSECEDYVIYTKVGCIISDVAGVIDYSDLVINGGNTNLEITSDNSVQLNKLTINVGG